MMVQKKPHAPNVSSHQKIDAPISASNVQYEIALNMGTVQHSSQNAKISQQIRYDASQQ